MRNCCLTSVDIFRMKYSYHSMMSFYYNSPWKRKKKKKNLCCSTCCCFRGRPLPLRWGSGGDWAVLGWGDGSLVPLLLMPVSVKECGHQSLEERPWGLEEQKSWVSGAKDVSKESHQKLPLSNAIASENLKIVSYNITPLILFYFCTVATVSSDWWLMNY